MFSVFARRQILARPSAALLSSLLRKVLPRRERADGDERVGNDRPPTMVALAPIPSRLALTTAYSSLFLRLFSHLSLLEKFSADVGMIQEFLVGQINIFIPRLHPILVCSKREVSEQFVRPMIGEFGSIRKCARNMH